MTFNKSLPAGTSSISDLDTILQGNFAVLAKRALLWSSGYPSVDTGIGLQYTMPFPGTFVKAWLKIKTAPTGADLIVDIKKNGTTIFTNQSNRPKIAAGDTSGISTSFDVSSFTTGDVLTCDIAQVGSTVAGVRLTVQLDFEHA